MLSAIGYVIYRDLPQVTEAAGTKLSRVDLAERYARGEISEDELRQRRNVVRDKSWPVSVDVLPAIRRRISAG